MRRLQYRFRIAYHSLRWAIPGRWHKGVSSPWMRCSRCQRRTWCEEIIAGCGWCNRCWAYHEKHDPVLGGDGNWPLREA